MVIAQLASIPEVYVQCLVKHGENDVLDALYYSSGGMLSNRGHYPFHTVLAACCSSAAVLGPVLMSSTFKAIA